MVDSDDELEKKKTEYWKSLNMASMDPLDIFRVGCDFGYVFEKCLVLGNKSKKSPPIGFMCPIRSSHALHLKKYIEDEFFHRVKLAWLNDDYMQIQVERR